MSDRYAEVAVLSGSPQRNPQGGAFTYAAPSGLALERGMAVVVPWRTRWALGVVLAVTAETEVAEPRPIARVLDPQPLLSAAQLELADWIANRYLAPIAACVQLFLPPGTPSRPRQSADRFRPLVPAVRQPLMRLVRAMHREQLEAAITVWPHSKRSRPADLLSALADQAEEETDGLPSDAAARLLGGAAALDDWLAGTTLAARGEDAVRLRVSAAEARAVALALRRTAAERRQLALLRELADDPRGELDEREAKRRSGAARTDIDRLAQAGYLERRTDSTTDAPRDPVPAPELTAEQQAAVEAISQSLESDAGAVFLLHGVTGSGKTEVYLSAADRALARGGGVIVLVPEIALAPQTIARFEARFPGQVAVRHSGLTRAAAREQWRQVYEGEKRILVGARSALFGPMRGLALVIIDEQHEWTYKQTDPQPRYHAGAVARELAQAWGVVTVLGSATPDVVSMAYARAAGGRLLTLTQRLQSGASGPRVIAQPTVEIVDLREELAAGVRSVFGRELDAAISDALARDEQVLLFLNRRGMSALVCRACGAAVDCGRCAIVMTLHRPGPYLQCHECGERQAAPRRCRDCGDERIGAMSFGTAQLEAEVRRRWGAVPITRWDRDTASAAASHEALLAEFADGRSRVLIGTQMIAKGLDLPRVTVAGVINADLSLRESDYQAAERTFQLLTQVAGRAGRGGLGGRVIIQTYSPDHFAVRAAASHDYEAFYRAELDYRRPLDYPPFGRLARLTVSRSTLAAADAEAARMTRELTERRDRTPGAAARVIGPAPAWPARRRNQWRRQIVLKGDDPRALLREVEVPRGWAVDLDPVG